jgi:hypothetical protein
MDLKTVCARIYYAVITAIGESKAPIAYINVRVGKKFTFSDDEFLSLFNKTKWDTVISTADLVIVHDDTLAPALRIEEISAFFDEDGKCNVYTVPLEDAIID